MSFIRYIQRLKRIDRLIRRKATGSPESFAEKLDISVSHLYAIIRDMRELGAPIKYCRHRGSYYYEYEVCFLAEFFDDDQLGKLRGGTASFFRPL
ncbi:MAG: hypothetical protein AB8F95_00425 [Bacteroidia bacterium]